MALVYRILMGTNEKHPFTFLLRMIYEKSSANFLPMLKVKPLSNFIYHPKHGEVDIQNCILLSKEENKIIFPYFIFIIGINSFTKLLESQLPKDSLLVPLWWPCESNPNKVNQS